MMHRFVWALCVLLAPSSAIGSLPAPGNIAAVCNNTTDDVTLINRTTYAVVGTISTFTASDFPEECSFTNNGSFLYVTEWNAAKVRVFETAAYSQVATISIGGHCERALMSPVGSLCYVTSDGDSAGAGAHVNVVDTTTHGVVGTISLPAGKGALCHAITVDGSFLYVPQDFDDSVVKVSTSTYAVIATISVGISDQALSITPDNSYVYVTNGGDSNASVIETASNTVIATLTTHQTPWICAMNKIGSLFCSPDNGGWDLSVFSILSPPVSATPDCHMYNPAGDCCGSYVTANDNGSTHEWWQSNTGGATVSVFDQACPENVKATISVGSLPFGIAFFDAPAATNTPTPAPTPTAIHVVPILGTGEFGMNKNSAWFGSFVNALVSAWLIGSPASAAGVNIQPTRTPNPSATPAPFVPAKIRTLHSRGAGPGGSLVTRAIDGNGRLHLFRMSPGSRLPRGWKLSSWDTMTPTKTPTPKP
jgi:YVTN family beta-propeller protein